MVGRTSGQIYLFYAFKIIIILSGLFDGDRLAVFHWRDKDVVRGNHMTTGYRPQFAVNFRNLG
jgi:hypothetical protein